ncbi:hypothetical protein M407DRAFT_241918, partial [Tulasnella calospora MUT 4182]
VRSTASSVSTESFQQSNHSTMSFLHWRTITGRAGLHPSAVDVPAASPSPLVPTPRPPPPPPPPPALPSTTSGLSLPVQF